MGIERGSIRLNAEQYGLVSGNNSEDGLEYFFVFNANLMADYGINVEEFCGFLTGNGAKILFDVNVHQSGETFEIDQDNTGIWVYSGTDASRRINEDLMPLYKQLVQLRRK